MAPLSESTPPKLDAHSGVQPETREDKLEPEALDIVRFFQGRSILVTGGTGFLGKALLEKLLRTCHTVSKIYVLTRAKPNSNLNSRMTDLFADPIFTQLKKQNPQNIRKVVPVQGDISLPKLGLSNEDISKICEDVSIVLHSAATIKFDEKLKKAMDTNVRGTQELIQLSKAMKHFTGFVHISTAYANCNLSEIHEIVYPFKTDAKELSERLEKMSDTEIEAITQDVIARESRPNTYTFTKAMTEVVLSQEDSIPIAIVRPSMVFGIWQEPLPGWTDGGTLGLSAVPALWGKGILRTMRVNGQNIIDIIPVDVVINLILAAAWELGTSNSKSLRVYNCCSGDQNPITWDGVRKRFSYYAIRNPALDAFWYPSLSFTRSDLVFKIKDTYQHYLPAMLMDLGCFFAGKKRRGLKMYHRLSNFSKLISYFMLLEFKFHTTNTRNLYGKLSSVDRSLFNFQIKELDYMAYFEDLGYGLRRHILKLDDASIPQSRVQIRKLYWIRTFTQSFVLFLVLICIFKIFGI